MLHSPFFGVLAMPQQSPQTARSWTVGCSPTCDILVNHPTVSGKHCRLTQHDHGFLLEDLNSLNGTFVDGRRLAPRAPLKISPLQPVVLGNDIPLPWPDEIKAAPAKAGASRVIKIGRAADCDVCFDYPIISGHHASITEQDGAYILEDLGSRNGTAINSIQNRIQHSPLLTSDEIFLGSFKARHQRPQLTK